MQMPNAMTLIGLALPKLSKKMYAFVEEGDKKGVEEKGNISMIKKKERKPSIEKGWVVCSIPLP